MSAGPAVYTRTAIAFHWIIAALIIGNLAFGFTIVDLPLSPAKLRYFSWHKWVGVTVFLLAAARLAWRLGHRPPPFPDTMKPWEKRAAHFGHAALYILFFGAPLTGWLFSSAAGFQTVYLGVLPIPDLLSKNHEMAEALKIAHHWVNYVLTGVVALHVAAAAKHEWVDRDEVLARIAPILKRSP